MLIVPTLCVGMPQWTLCVRFGTRSVLDCIPTRSVGTIGVVAQSSFFINPAKAAKGLCVALAIFGVLSEPSPKYCWSV